MVVLSSFDDDATHVDRITMLGCMSFLLGFFNTCGCTKQIFTLISLCDDAMRIYICFSYGAKAHLFRFYGPIYMCVCVFLFLFLFLPRNGSSLVRSP